MVLCPSCGKENKDSAKFCIKCGEKIHSMKSSAKLKEVKWTTALYISLFLGWLGIDRFYLGKVGTGILKGITLGGFGIWWLIDLILIMASYKFKNISWKAPKSKTIHIVVAIILIIVFFAIGQSDSNNSTPTKSTPAVSQQTTTVQKEPEIFNDNLAQFVSEFWSYTDLQREEKWKSYKGKYVKWTFYVKSVDKDMFGTYTVLGSAKKPGPYDIGSDVTVKFPDSEKESLLKYNEGDLMTIVGVLDYYSGTIMNTLQVKPAKVVSTENIKYADSGEYSEDCQEIKSLCNQGDGNACLALLQLQQEDLC